MKLFSGPPLSQFSDTPPGDKAAVPGDPHPTQAPATPLARPAASPSAPVAAKAAAGRPAATQAKPAPSAGAASAARPSSAAPRPAPRRAEVTHANRAIPDRAEPARLRLVPIPRLAQGGRWRVEAMRSLSEPLLLWFTRGQGRITVGGITRGYGTHNAIFVPLGVMHGFEVGPQTYGTAVFFGHDSGIALPAEPLHLRIRDTASQGEVGHILDNVQRELDSARPGAERAARHHLGLLGVWIERQTEALAAEARKPAAAQRLARAYADLLERDFRTGQGVADYARILGVTPTHLSRVCNQTCGRSASDLLHDRLIFEARRLLAETKVPVNVIAAELGFTSPAYFTRAFQHRTGKTPTGFRKQG